MAAPQSDPHPVRIVLADDSVLFREGAARVLTENGFAVVGQAGDASQLLDLVEQLVPDIVITDIRMPPTGTNEGLLAARRIRQEHPEAAVLVLSQYVHTRHAVDLLRQSPGRVGYLLKERISDPGQLQIEGSNRRQGAARGRVREQQGEIAVPVALSHLGQAIIVVCRQE